MKNDGRSLEEQRNALLEQIHASRAVYRRMLTQGESIETASAHEHAAAGTDIREEAAAHATPSSASAKAGRRMADPNFPRSMTMRWIMDHPFYTAAAVVGVAMLLPKAARAGKRAGGKIRSRKRGKEDHSSSAYVPPTQAQGSGAPAYGPYPQPVYIQQPSPQKTGAVAGAAAFGGTALTSIITIATMVMRDPAKMRMAMKLFSTASNYLRKRHNEKTGQGNGAQ
jgi:hypothetical protein